MQKCTLICALLSFYAQEHEENEQQTLHAPRATSSGIRRSPTRFSLILHGNCISFSITFIKSDINGILWTHTGTCPTSNTFSRVRCLYRIHLHLAHLSTFSTIHTLMLINFQMIHTDLIHQTIDGTKWAHCSAKKAIHKNTANYC